MPATSERLILDPSEGISNRTAFAITDWVDQEGPDYGEAAIEAFMADGDRGSVPVDFTVPNREITIPLKGVARGGTTWPTALASFQSKVALFQKEGGVLKRLTNSGGTVYADIVDASLTATSTTGWESQQDIDLEGSLSLTVLPDWYGAEIQLADHTETTAAELVFTETSIDGDYPARVRMVVDDDQAVDQRGLIFGYRSRFYSSASTAAIPYEAESLGTLDTAAKTALSGASGGTVVTHGTLSTSWTPVLSTNVAGTQFLTHQGTYRLWGRVYSTSGSSVQARAVWDVGDLVNPVENDAWRLPAGTAFLCHDFGEVRLDAAPVGTHRWQGQIQAKGDSGSENFSVDKIWLAPVDEGYGVLTAPAGVQPGLSTGSYSARSEFNTESGAPTGDALAVGGSWTVVTNSDTTDFNVTAGAMERTAASDTGTGQGPLVGRGITAGATSYTNIDVKVDFSWSQWQTSGNLASGVLARVTDSNNYLYATVGQTATTGIANLYVTKWVASSQTVLGNTTIGNFGSYDATGLGSSGAWTIELLVLATGGWECSVYPNYAGRVSVVGGGVYTPPAVARTTLAGNDSALATGGTLATGKIGVVDYTTMASPGTRVYDSFVAWVPATDAVTFASRSTQLTSTGHYRQDSGGTAYGPVSYQSGDLPRLPVAGVEGRTTEVFLKNSRGDFNQIPDNHTTTAYGDDISARITYQPCWLHVPGT